MKRSKEIQLIMRIKAIKINLELTQLLELTDKDVKTAVPTTFPRFKRVSRDVEFFKDSSSTSRDDSCVVSYENCFG